MQILPEHLTAARGLLRISQAELGALSGVSDRTIKHFEAGKSHVKDETLWRIQLALEHCGVEFLNSGRPGVRYHPDRDRRRMSASELAKPTG